MAMPQHEEDQPVVTEASDVASLVAENASLRDRLLRALADAENARRRADRAAEDARKYAIAEFGRELLLVVDNLQRTLDAINNRSAPADGTIVEGIQVTLRIFIRTLERFGIREIEALGRPFDPAVHEAIMEVDDPVQPPGTVVRVVEPGYLIHDRLLRPARVVVAKRRSAAAPASAEVIEDLGAEWAPHEVNRQ
jgi:molecular chaperone GrpE